MYAYLREGERWGRGEVSSRLEGGEVVHLLCCWRSRGTGRQESSLLPLPPASAAHLLRIAGT